MSKEIVKQAKEAIEYRKARDRISITRDLLQKLEVSEGVVKTLKRLIEQVESGDYTYVDSQEPSTTLSATIAQCTTLQNELLKLAESSTLGLKPKR